MYTFAVDCKLWEMALTSDGPLPFIDGGNRLCGELMPQVALEQSSFCNRAHIHTHTPASMCCKYRSLVSSYHSYQISVSIFQVSFLQPVCFLCVRHLFCLSPLLLYHQPTRETRHESLSLSCYTDCLSGSLLHSFSLLCFCVVFRLCLTVLLSAARDALRLSSCLFFFSWGFICLFVSDYLIHPPFCLFVSLIICPSVSASSFSWEIGDQTPFVYSSLLPTLCDFPSSSFLLL